MKKLLILLVAAAFLITSCLDPSNNTVRVTETAPAVKFMKILMISCPDNVEDSSFNQDIYNGVMDFLGEVPGATVKSVQEPDVAKAMETLTYWTPEFDVIIAAGFNFANVYDTADRHPNKKFILVDGDRQNRKCPPNLYVMQFLENESGFFAGIAAALETNTGKVAVVTGMVCASNINYQYGFESGVNYANAHCGTSAEFVTLPEYADGKYGGNYIGSFTDPSKAAVIAGKLIGENCDIIFTAAGSSGNGVINAVKAYDISKGETEVKVIGCDTDQYDLGSIPGGLNVILTSAYKRMRYNVKRQLYAIKDGYFSGETIRLGAASDSTGYIKEKGRQSLRDGTVEKLEEAYTLVKNGFIIPPSFVNNYATDYFPGLQ